LAEDFTKTKIRQKSNVLQTLGKFLNIYIHQENMSTIPAEFLKSDYPAKSFYTTCFGDAAQPKVELKHAHDFIDWVLENYFSVEDDNGNRIVLPEYCNPIPLDLPDGVVLRDKLDESNKNALPYRYIKQLRTILCPKDANHFKDWKWAHEALEGSGDWLIVDPSIIKNDDPDCVWRKREISKHDQKLKELPEIVYELWSPVRAVVIYTKLLVPLRTYQVRMLDSSEADTFRYEQPKRQEVGQWNLNHGFLREGSEKYPVRRGVFRQFFDSETKIPLTGFYINTNKTADINKDERSKGYEIPWQYEEALYWMAKLRNWQEKYNPIEKPTAWTELEKQHLGHAKDISILKQMGATCFLFRNAAEEDKDKPIQNRRLDALWARLLLRLEKQCETVASNENKLKFVKDKYTTFYPLHSLRVSLITAYALEGGVPMPILSKCIVGHARLVMTLY